MTLGGGIGWLARKHGLTIDSLVAAEIVTADGEVLTASETSIPTCSGRCAAAAATSASSPASAIGSSPVGEVLGGALFLPATRDVLRSLVPIASSAPEELTVIGFAHGGPAGSVRPGGARRPRRACPHVRVCR
jgi:hypothetical protein